VRHQLEEGASKRAAFEASTASRPDGRKSWADPAAPVGYDILHYDLDLHVDPSRQVLSGSVTLDLTAVDDGLATIELDADLGLRILSVLQLGDERYPYDTPLALAFRHADDRLAITLARPLPAGGGARLLVTYGGHAWRDGLIGSTGVNWYSNGGVPVIHTFAQPYGARVWWPCNDRPDDKATVTLRVTVPEGLDVASNGLERSYEDNGDGTSTAVWSSHYPVPTYLVVMHISDFAYSESTYTGLDGTTMPVGLWAMPPVAAQAEADLAVCVPQMEVMAGHWGEYPFLDEKYGNATVFFGGGMEHQTMTTLSVYQVGDPWMEWLNVHEMGHQWWGDWVTMDDWRDTWLNEGFATHTEWLWAEHLGPDVLAGYLDDEDWRGWFSGPVYDNPVPFSWTIYAKGSWVAWMLRHVIGDDAFFDAMAAYRAANAGATGTTDELETAMEAAGGIELDWFFDQWVYGLYRPRYVYSWESVAGPAVELTVRQVQTNTGLFRMPMSVRVTTIAGAEEHRVWLEAEAEQTVVLALQAEATAVELNHDRHVLAEIAHVSEPDLELGADFPDGYDFGLVPGTATETRQLPLTNTGGADLLIHELELQTGSVFRLVDPPTLPLTIPPGETRTLDLRFDPTGYGRQSDQLAILSNDPDRGGVALVPMAGTGSLYDEGRLAAPSSATIGRTPLGGTGEGGFDVLNLGGRPLPVQTAVTGDGFFLASSVPAVLAPGSSNEVRVRFHPIAVGPAEGSVVFHQGDPANPLKTVRIAATADGAPRLELTPAALSLGVGDDDITATLRVANTGTEELQVSALVVTPPFVLVSPAAPFAVATGAAETIVVGLAPDAAGTLEGHLTVHSNDPAVPVARLPLVAHVADGPAVAASFPAAASGPGLGDARWTTRAYLVNPTDAALPTDLLFRDGSGRSGDDPPDAGIEVPARSQRVVSDLVAATGHTGTGGVTLRSAGDGLIAVSRTFASDEGGTYGQLVGATAHADALTGGGRYVLAGLAGNGGFHTNVGILNLGETPLAVDLWFNDSAGQLIGTRRIEAQPGAFRQIVAVISRLTGETIRGGSATFTAADPGARYLAYASVVDDASSDPTLALPQLIGGDPDGGDLVIPAAAALPGAGGTTWRSQLDVVNTAAETRQVTVEYVRSSGASIASMVMEIEPGATLHFDDVVGGLFGEQGKGWLRVTASGPGVHAASRTYNDDASGTYGQLIPAFAASAAAGPEATVVLAGLSSLPGARTNLGLTSLASSAASCTVEAFDGGGASIGEHTVELPANGFVQVERLLDGELGFVGEAWAEVRCPTAGAAFFAHASVVDETTGDPIYVPGLVLGTAP
nr:choice-of-anchor D domain-containing protein [Thermoanaerobaculales bacterium]